jgi:UDP-N-acetylmuramate dehydrogenase
MALPLEFERWLRQRLGGAVRFDEPMSRHTWLRVGGPAEAWAAPERVEDLTALVRRAGEAAVPLRVVGDGTNLLVSDDGVEGVVVVLRRCLHRIAATGESGGAVRVTAMAGARLQALCRFAVERGLEGMRFAVGIPGTVGGAVVMNAGTGTGSMGDVMEAVTVLHRDGTPRVVERRRLRCSYRRFSVAGAPPGEDPLVLGADVLLHRGDPERIRRETTALLELRRRKQPLAEASAGCFFKNPVEGPPAGALIDEAGLKGLRVGGAEVSAVHGNFIVNRGGATAADILKLAGIVRSAVRERFGVSLEEEVQVIGRVA